MGEGGLSGVEARRARLISVIGAGACGPEVAARARELGRLLAGAGYGVVCGGLGGVMEAVCAGAFEAGGLTVGILPGPDAAAATPYVQVVIPTDLGHARNVLVVRAGLAAIAVAGGYGTLWGMALALKMGKPVISIDSWAPTPEVRLVGGPVEAVALVREILEGAGPGRGA